MRKDVQLPSPPIHLAVFRDPGVHGFSYNNTQAVGGGERAQHGLVATVWGQQVERDVARSQKPHNHNSSAAASRHTHGAQRPGRGHGGGPPISPPVSQISFFNTE